MTTDSFVSRRCSPPPPAERPRRHLELARPRRALTSRLGLDDDALRDDKQRAVVILRDVLGRSARAVAEALAESVRAVTGGLQRARGSLGGVRPDHFAPGRQERALGPRVRA